MRASVDRRIRVQVVRRRLEESAATAVERTQHHRPLMHQRVPGRLLLLPAVVPEDRRAAARRLAERARSVYAATSDVMHSRRAFGDVPEYLVQEWEAAADEVENFIGSVGPSQPSKEV